MGIESLKLPESPDHYQPYAFPPRKKDPDFLGKLRKQKVKIVMNNGDECSGVIVGYNRYEITVKLSTSPSEDIVILIMKHAIGMIVPDDGTLLDKKKEPVNHPLPYESEDGKRMTD